jgi:ribosome-associated protein
VDLEVTPRLTIPAGELQWKFSRSSGPGGQHVNTSDSRVQLTWSVTDSAVLSDGARQALLEKLGASITTTASARRSQLQNRQAALDSLAELLRAALAPAGPQRRATRPTRGSRLRHLTSKKQRSTTKQNRQRPTRD